MAGIQAKAVYSFESAGDGELTINENDILTILRQDVGDGWWEARNDRGEVGLVPEAYLEITSVPEPSFPPPPPPAPTQTRNSWGAPPVQAASGRAASSYTPQTYQPQPATTRHTWQQPVPAANAANDARQGYGGRGQDSVDQWDDDDDSWDDDDSSTTTETPDLGSTGGSGVGAKKDKQSKDKDDKFGTVKARPFSKYSNFTKSGGEAYLFTPSNKTVPVEEFRARIIETADGPMWEQGDDRFTSAITSPKKETKFKGIKAYIAYQVTPSFSNIQVSRRYKHFDWLHQQLEHKLSTVCVPPLPDKQVSGRFEEDFVADRMRQLQMWMDRICRHPVLMRTDVLHHFLSCTDEKKWKAGKRKAEKDEFQGGQWFLTVETPRQHLDSTDTEVKLDRFAKYVKNMDDSVRHTINVSEGMAKRHQGPFKKEYAKLGGSFVALAKSFEFDERPGAQPLTDAMDHCGKTYEEIGQLFQEQPRKDLYPLLDGLLEYKGILSTFPDVLNVYRAACNKIHENAGKLSNDEVARVQERADVIAYCTMAEMNHFDENRTVDYKAYMQHFLRGQIDFYKQITGKLEDALHRFDQA